MRHYLILSGILFLFSCHGPICEPTFTVGEQTPVPGKFALQGPVHSSIVTSDGQVIHCQNMGAQKTYATGLPIWMNQFDEYFYPAAITETNEADGFIIAGCKLATNPTDQVIIISKISPDGKTVWKKKYGQGDRGITSIARTYDNNYLLAGSIQLPGETESDIYLAKINSNGDTLWTKRYENAGSETVYGIIGTADHNYLVTADNYAGNYERATYLLKINAAGEQIWDSRTASPGGQLVCFNTISLVNGDLVSCGLKTTGSGTNSKTIVIRTSSSGQQVWSREFGTDTTAESAWGVIASGDDLVIAGKKSVLGSDMPAPYLFSIKNDGTLNWRHDYPGGDHFTKLSLSRLPGGEFVIFSDYFMIVTDKEGNM